MKILIIGGGGREHAIAWKLGQSDSVEKIWCAPGNGGIAELAECWPLDLSDARAAANLAGRLGADLTVVGPELPLVLGVADEFAARGLKMLGPSRIAAQLEGSKIFAKQFMERHRIPTAALYGVFDTVGDARRALARANSPVVIKADGLCSGKGVLVTSSRDEASDFVARLVDQREFGNAGERVLMEDALRGEELSYIILTDGEHFIPMVPSRDHKRAYDNDAGPNTGGMGAYSTDDLLPGELEREIVDTVVRPTLEGLRKDGLPYRGFLYFGLMLTPDGAKVLEYNCRLGDPETEAILLRADFDFAAACLQAADGSLENFPAKRLPGASACVVVASEGYPKDPIIGREITGLDEAAIKKDSWIFHASTRREGESCYTTGGRVLAVAARSADLTGALGSVYDCIASIHIQGSFYRQDIGAMAKGRAAPGGGTGLCI